MNRCNKHKFKMFLYNNKKKSIIFQSFTDKSLHTSRQSFREIYKQKLGKFMSLAPDEPKFNQERKSQEIFFKGLNLRSKQITEKNLF